MGGKRARAERDAHRKSDEYVNTSILNEIDFNSYSDNEIEIHSNHVCVEYGPSHQIMDDEVFIKTTETKKQVKNKLKVKIERLSTKLEKMKKKCQILFRKKSVLEDIPTEYDKERQNFVNNLAAKCTRIMNEFIATSYNVTRNVIEANTSEKTRQSKQNPHRKKRPSRSEREKKDRQRKVEWKKKEKFFERSKQIQQRRSKNKNEVLKQISQQQKIERGELNYKTLLLIMNQRDRHEQQTGIGENPYTKGLNVEPYSFTESFHNNEQVIQSVSELTEIHRKRKIERNMIDEQQDELVRKIAKTNEDAIAA